MCRPDGRHVLNNQGTDDYVLTKYMKIACLRIVLRHVPVLQLHVHVQAQVMIRLETIFREM